MLDVGVTTVAGGATLEVIAGGWSEAGGAGVGAAGSSVRSTSIDGAASGTGAGVGAAEEVTVGGICVGSPAEGGTVVDRAGIEAGGGMDTGGMEAPEGGTWEVRCRRG